MNKSIIITGCSTGIGLCAAKTLKTRGYRVFATARKSADLETLQQQGLESIELDLNDSSSIRTAVNEITARLPTPIYALINNAGYGQSGAVEDLSRETLRRQFEANVFGLQELTNLIIPFMCTQNEGRIINISSVLGRVAMPFRGAYCASKYALEALTDAMRLELRGSGISVALIEPGPIQSHFRDTVAVNFNALAIGKSPHRTTYEAMLRNRSQKKITFSKPPEAVVKKIIHALESPHPKLRYRVTFPAYLLTILKRSLPDKWFDDLMVKISEGDIKNP